MRLAINNALGIFYQAVSNLVGSGSSSGNLTNLFKKNKSAIRYRFTVQESEVFRFPSECQELHVLSGIAWISVAAKDIILTSKETASFASDKNAIISPLGRMPLVLEIH